ncbi:MAG: T9SS type A sorting domain-containing protein [Rhodothermaceae bacterium]|nr:T9SS type A sorting domain-containing protein [Rhodothermaceae bacterium]
MARRCFSLLVVLLVAVSVAQGQTLDITFRFLPDVTAPPIAPVERAFLPGSFNDWGPNNSGQIDIGAPSQMALDAALEEYRYTIPLEVGGQGNGSDPSGGYTYKVHVHEDESGTTWQWLTDPLGSETFGPNNDSVIRVADPMAFQLAREQNASGQIAAVSVGLFGTEAFTSITFTVNEDPYTTGITDTGDGIYRLELPAPVPPGSFFRVEAEDAMGRMVEAEVGVIPPTVVDEAVPAFLDDGITYSDADDTSAWLVLRAPSKSYVYVLGDFNGWQVDDAYLMKRDPDAADGTRWWLELMGLTPGTEIVFQYFVDGVLRVADPYAAKVLYPGEVGYPDGQTDFAVGVLRPGAPAFPWTDGSYERPAQEDLVIYELLVRDFLADHSFTSLIDSLDYLERLGVNAIELMPIAEFDGDESWGYNPAFYFAVDKYYGATDDFKAFVDAAHARGMAVLLDVVYNHATGQSPFVRLYNQGDFGAPTADNPWMNVSATHPFNVFNDVNHESPLTQLWLDKVNRWWIEEYHVDGFRFDLSAGFMQTGDFFNYNPGRIALLTRMIEAIYDVEPDTYVILEHLINSTQEWQELTAIGQGAGRKGPVLWHHMNREYSQSAMGYPTATDFPSTLTQTYAPNWAGGIGIPNAATYMESHDEQWLMFRNFAFGNQNGSYSVRNLWTALDRQKLIGAFFFTVPGPRMLWQFGELGYGGGPGECLRPGDGSLGDCPAGTPDRVANKPIRWDYWVDGVAPVPGTYTGTLMPEPAAERALRQKLYKTWAALANLRQDYALFRSLDTEVDLQLGLTSIRHIDLSLPSAPGGEPTKALIFGNFGVTEGTFSFTLAEPTTWYDFFDDTEVTFQAGTHEVTLQAGEFHLWTDVDVPSPEPGLITVAHEPLAEGPASFRLKAVYPNPVTGSATVAFSMPEAGAARLEVFDVLGRKVATLLDEARAAGSYAVPFEAAGLPSGLYLARLTAAGQTATQAITVVR